MQVQALCERPFAAKYFSHGFGIPYLGGADIDHLGNNKYVSFGVPNFLVGRNISCQLRLAKGGNVDRHSVHWRFEKKPSKFVPHPVCSHDWISRMNNKAKAHEKVPTGVDFLSLLRRQELRCERETMKRLLKSGIKAKECHQSIGTVLSRLDRMASCWWQCSRGDHVIEYLCGRSESAARAAIRMCYSGLYDESLAAARGMGEIGNLLYLFSQKSEALQEWKNCSRRERLSKYSPRKVRLQLEKLAGTVPITEERYRLLSERASHVCPATKPQAHNVFGFAGTGGHFQEVGALLCLNEIALPLAIVILGATPLLNYKKDLKLQILESGRKLVESIGGATIDSIDEYYEQTRASPEFKENLKRMRDLIEGETKAARQLGMLQRRHPTDSRSPCGNSISPQERCSD